MNLDGAMRIASGGLMNIDRQLALIAQNVANADTPDYARQVGSQQNLTADGQGLGVVGWACPWQAVGRQGLEGDDPWREGGCEVLAEKGPEGRHFPELMVAR